MRHSLSVDTAPRYFREHYIQQRIGLLKTYRADLNCNNYLRGLSQITDALIQSLYQHYKFSEHIALVATGGYGRQELYPLSDIDLLFLTNDQLAIADANKLALLTNELWNTHLKPSHWVAAPATAQQEAQKDVRTETALLESRFLIGSQRLYTELQNALQTHRDTERFIVAKRAEITLRHRRFNNTTFALEPNCKESPGALRDIQSMRWISYIQGHMPLNASWTNCPSLTQAQASQLNRAEHAFKRLRIELHLLNRPPIDVVSFEVQSELARRYAYTDRGLKRASEIMMQRYYWAARTISQFREIIINTELNTVPQAIQACHILDSNFYIKHNKLYCNTALRIQPEIIFDAFIHYQTHSTIQGFSADLLNQIWHAKSSINQDFRQNKANQQNFIKIFQAQQRISETLTLMDELNVLPRYLPEFRKISGQMQHNLFHAYTVDQHILKVIERLEQLHDSQGEAVLELPSKVFNDFKRQDLIYIAALFHDIAKGQEQEHSLLGADLVNSFCLRHGINNQDTQLLTFLVKEHLSLSQTAQKKDLNDPITIKNFCQLVQNKECLQALYLLTIADIQATGPSIWSSWKQLLLNELYQLSINTLNSTNLPKTSRIRHEQFMYYCDNLSSQSFADKLKKIWLSLDDNFLQKQSYDDLLLQVQAIAAENTQDIIVKATYHALSNTIQVVIYMPDAADIFLKTCTFLSQKRFSVLEANLYTHSNQYAHDILTIQRTHTNTSPDDLVGIEQGLKSYLKNEIAIKKLTQHQHRSRQSQAFPIAPKIHLHPENENGHWKLEIEATDKPQLLRDIAVVFRQYNITLIDAKIATLGERVEDTFTLYHPKFETIKNNFVEQIRLTTIS